MLLEYLFLKVNTFVVNCLLITHAPTDFTIFNVSGEVISDADNLVCFG